MSNIKQQTLEYINFCSQRIEDITKQPDFNSDIEYWRMCIDIPGYEVSTFGNVRKASRKMYACSGDGNEVLLEVIPPKPVNIYKGNKQGYYMVTIGLPGNRKQIGVHRLVAMNFINKPFTEKGVVHHKDGNKSNNHVENLEYVTYKEHAKKTNELKTTTTIFTGIKCITTNQYFSSIKAVSQYFYIPYMYVQKYLFRQKPYIPEFWNYEYDFILVSKQEVLDAMKNGMYVKVDTVGKPNLTLAILNK